MTSKMKNIDSLSPEADKIIKKYAVGSSLTGFIPVYMLDLLALAYVQRIMIPSFQTVWSSFFKTPGKSLDNNPDQCCRVEGGRSSGG